MDERLKKAHTIIKNEYQNEILLDTLAEKVGLSKYHLHRLFKVEFNETPAECLLRTRLELANHYLKLKTQMSISQLAVECGFSSLSVFSRAFTKRYGVSPSKVRRQKELKINPNKSKMEVEVITLPEIILCYEPTQFMSKTLNNAFEKAISRSKRFGLQSKLRKIGVLNHLNVHHGNYKLNYYAGVEVEGKVSVYRMKDLFIIPEGRYASFISTSKRELFIQELINLKYNWLDHSCFVIRDLFALEEILDEAFMLRRILIPIKKGIAF